MTRKLNLTTRWNYTMSQIQASVATTRVVECFVVPYRYQSRKRKNSRQRFTQKSMKTSDTNRCNNWFARPMDGHNGKNPKRNSNFADFSWRFGHVFRNHHFWPKSRLLLQQVGCYNNVPNPGVGRLLQQVGINPRNHLQLNPTTTVNNSIDQKS